MDPITTAMAAFAAVQKTVEVIKKAKATIDDVSSLGPLVGQFFSAKQQTVKALEEAKKQGGSSLAQAIQIEMQLLSQKKFEDELKMIFFQTGHADIWENIMKRVKEGEQAEREARRRANDAARVRARKMAEMVNLCIGIGLVVLLVPPLAWLVIQGIMFAKDK
jgi:type II secretory pathway predicted ATPase ExeA